MTIKKNKIGERWVPRAKEAVVEPIGTITFPDEESRLHG